MLCCYLNVFVFVYIIDLKNIPFISMVYINECIDVNTVFLNPLNLWLVQVGNISFQEISCAGKSQVASRYILSNLWLVPQLCLLIWSGGAPVLFACPLGDVIVVQLAWPLNDVIYDYIGYS